MRVLIGECIDEQFWNSLPGDDCQTTRYAGLAGLKNGELLTAAETAKFGVFLTVEKDLLPHVSACLAHIESIQPGQIGPKSSCMHRS
jgi:hypothetical protein